MCVIWCVWWGVGLAGDRRAGGGVFFVLLFDCYIRDFAGTIKLSISGTCISTMTPMLSQKKAQSILIMEIFNHIMLCIQRNSYFDLCCNTIQYIGRDLLSATSCKSVCNPATTKSLFKSLAIAKQEHCHAGPTSQ